MSAMGRLAALLRRVLRLPEPFRRTPPGEIAYKPSREVSDAAWERARTIPTKRGDKVRSWGEARVADWLHDRGIRYEYEPLVAGRRPDFLLPELGVVIEYSGVEREDYARRHAERMRVYRERGIPVVALRGKRWTRVDAELEAGLRKWGWRP